MTGRRSDVFDEVTVHDPNDLGFDPIRVNVLFDRLKISLLSNFLLNLSESKNLVKRPFPPNNLNL